jgi:glycosyltransferase involved in cell wall biosynthesis
LSLEGVLRNQDNVILVEPGNPGQVAQTIIDLLSGHERRADIAERARRTIQKHFPWNSVCSRTLDVYREVLLEGAVLLLPEVAPEWHERNGGQLDS